MGNPQFHRQGGKGVVYLARISDGYEPILYGNGRFRVKPEDVAKPVVLGAWAYAAFYGKQLPRISQWWFVVDSGRAPGAPVGSEEPEAVGAGKDIGSVNHTRPNRLGIKGLKQNVHEWTVAGDMDAPPEFYIHGLDNTESYLERQYWEAFSNVGFRTVLPVEETP